MRSRPSYTAHSDPATHFAGAGPDLFDLAVTLGDARARAEVELVGAVLADPGRLVIVAEYEGITAAAFDQYDLRLIWCAADVARHLPVIDVLKLARRAMREDHFWDPAGPYGITGSRWSDETLAALAERFPTSVAATRYAARHLAALNARWQRAERLLRELREALTVPAGERPLSDDTSVLPVATPEPFVIVNAPIRRRRDVA